MSDHEKLKGIYGPIRHMDFVETSLAHIRDKKPFLISGAGDSVQNHLSQALANFSHQPIAVIFPNELKAREALEEMKFYDPFGTYFLPAKDPLFYSVDVHGMAIEESRMKVFRALREGKVSTLVMSVEALYDRLIPRETWESFIIRKRIGEDLPMEELVPRLALMGYERNDQVEAPGQFAVRGGIVDIYPIQADTALDNAIRIELWGDEIDSIRVLDAETQRSQERLEYATVFPVSEILVTQDQIDAGTRKIRKELAEEEKRLRGLNLEEEADRLRGMTEHFLNKLSSGKIRGLESYTTLFYDHTVSILDYIDPRSILIFQEPARIRERIRSLKEEMMQSLEGRLRGGYLLPSQKNMFPDFDEIEPRMNPFARVFMCSLLSSSQDAFYIQDIVRINSRSINVLSGDGRVLLDEMKSNASLGYATLLLYEGSMQAQRAVSLLKDEGVPAYLYDDFSQDVRSGAVAAAKGSLKKGFAYPDAKFALISLQELAEKSKRGKKRKRRKFKAGEKISSFSDLTVGDYVVHENHGVGIYQGIVQIDDENSRRDYFKINYRDGGVLYVPTTSLDMLQKYVAGEGVAPKVNRLGGADWMRTKAKVKESVKKLAQDLIVLYAERQEKQGYAFSKDTVWQREFEDAFPFEETDDQLNAIEDTKRDMESHHIMDRLICGDVGYGKTEIAIRAAFKAAQDSKQVALLAPTTILAQQHYNTFVSRMKDYPVRVGLLSRFNTPKEMKEVLTGVRAGTIDIVIGTHRLLSKDVVFHNLGLLVVDEEQRFGVSHKEKIKALKKDVDVLTLSATPIPRTLHMSLNGMRDMSVLEEAPRHRIPVQTFVMEDDEEMVREAIYRELGRGGQVFYLYNRVNNIEMAAHRIQEMIPEARVELAHGQMEEHQLEKVMLRFVEGDIDVLVCTTIIETGLDIPNANTLIVRDADTMGLSQLYQLRGRVGRSTRMAYAYFLYRRGKVLQETAQKRLEAIGEFTEFGSGFKIAMRDLEIRGAGNVLGPEQHGHMGAVGYDLYCKLLREAMDSLQNKPSQEDFETTVYIHVDAFIPSSYISNERQKLEAYKKIAAIRNEEDYNDMFDELIDRYSDMPQSVSNLLMISFIKALANFSGAEMIEYSNGTLTLKLREDALIDFDKLSEYLKQHQGEVRILSSQGQTRLTARVDHSPKDDVLLQRILDKMKEIARLHIDEAEEDEQRAAL